MLTMCGRSSVVSGARVRSSELAGIKLACAPVSQRKTCPEEESLMKRTLLPVSVTGWGGHRLSRFPDLERSRVGRTVLPVARI